METIKQSIGPPRLQLSEIGAVPAMTSQGSASSSSSSIRRAVESSWRAGTPGHRHNQVEGPVDSSTSAHFSELPLKRSSSFHSLTSSSSDRERDRLDCSFSMVFDLIPSAMPSSKKLPQGIKLGSAYDLVKDQEECVGQLEACSMELQQQCKQLLIRSFPDTLAEDEAIEILLENSKNLIVALEVSSNAKFSLSRVVGLVLADAVFTQEDGTLDFLCVEPERRRQGIGRALAVSALKYHARQRRRKVHAAYPAVGVGYGQFEGRDGRDPTVEEFAAVRLLYGLGFRKGPGVDDQLYRRVVGCAGVPGMLAPDEERAEIKRICALMRRSLPALCNTQDCMEDLCLLQKQAKDEEATNFSSSPHRTLSAPPRYAWERVDSIFGASALRCIDEHSEGVPEAEVSSETVLRNGSYALLRWSAWTDGGKEEARRLENKIREEIAAAGGVELLQLMIEHDLLPGDAQSAAVEALWNLIRHSDERTLRVTHERCLQTLVSLLGFGHCIRTRLNACSIVSRLALFDDKLPLLRDCGTFPSLIDCCKSLNPALELSALIAINNFCLVEDYCLELAKLQAHEWLIPLLAATDDIAFGACRVIALMCLHDSSAFYVRKSQALHKVARYLRTSADFGALFTYILWTAKNCDSFVRLAWRKDLPVVRLVGIAALNRIGRCIKSVPENGDLLRREETMAVIQDCAMDTDAFVYRFAADLLRRLMERVPDYNEAGKKEGEADAQEKSTESWTVEDVCRWVRRQRFACYEQNFFEAWVDGEILPQLTDELLRDMGISHGVHRLRILRDIKRLTEEGERKSADGQHGLGLIRTPSQTAVDVFISYRRSNGSQLAQLIKVCLTQRGLRVFLDVDNLGPGQFDNSLLEYLRCSKNVVVILTKGSLDRCIEDPMNSDWVRKEIAHAIQWQKTVVPVTHEFEWPALSELPPDIQGIARHNGVQWSHVYQNAAIEKVVSFLNL